MQRYSNESDLNSFEEVNSENTSQLEAESFKTRDASDSSVLEQINQYSNGSGADALDQVTNVTQLRDVSPGDWAFEALRSLVERYGCIAGYPDGTYRGNRAMTRYEFAAGLNACLQQVERLIRTAGEGAATREDLITLQRLIDEFGPELAGLRGRVDALEARTTELELTQFSTTTKLDAQVVFALAGIATGDNALGEEIPNVVAFGDRIRLNFDTSFTGKDILRTRLQALNLRSFSGTSTFTPEGDLRFAEGTFGTESNNDVEIDALLYAFPIGKTTVVIEANAGAPDDFTNTVNPFIDGDGDTGALSNFATRNPIYGLVGGAGIGIRHTFSDALELSLGYLAAEANDPNEGSGLFDGPYGAIAQVTVKPIEKLTLGLTYINAYNADLTAGSNRANLRTALADNPNLPVGLQPFTGLTVPTSSNSYGVEASFQVSPNFYLGGWVGYTNTRTLSTAGGVLPRGDLDIWNWAATLTFPDLGREGNVAALIVGMEPKVTDVSPGLRGAIGEDRDTSLHIEGFYQFKVTDNIAITPGVIWLTAPDHNSNNNDIVIGTIRTTFSF
ncbi:MAG: iron uptake porin [Cyanobacteriota bacterium]